MFIGGALFLSDLMGAGLPATAGGEEGAEAEDGG